MEDVLFNAQKRLSFDEESHTYWLDGDKSKELISTTTFLDQFIRPFERDKWSQHVALRDNMTQKEVLEKWEKSASFSKDFGTKVHKFAECLFTGQQPPKFETEKEKATFKAVLEFYKYAVLNYKTFISEAVLFDEENKLAGTADLLAQDHDGNWHILDFKTNKKIRTENRYHTMLAPVDHLEDCHLSHYSLQLNIYANMIKKMTGVDVMDKTLVHVNEDGYKLYRCKELHDEVQALLEHQKKQETKQQLIS